MILRNVSALVCGVGFALSPFVLGCVRAVSEAAATSGSVVRVEGNPGSFRLMRNGSPYFVRGAGGTASMDFLSELGGNSVRTWGAEQIGEALDEAHKRGLTVTAGIWLGHTGAFDYGDPVKVKEQFEMCREVVQKYKDHPALLMWAFGNEHEGNGKDRRVWEATEQIAAMAKKLDPNHPTMTVIAEIGDDKVKSIQQICKSIDIIGINSYGGAPTLAKRFAEQGGVKPYIVTEFGPLGPWEVPKTRWDAPIEATSTDKAAFYKKSYEAAVESAKGTCLGSYAFLWGHKQEATSTWFGMLLASGEHVGAVDVMSEKWTGKPRKNLVPIIRRLETPQTDGLIQGQEFVATLEATDPEGKPLRVKWMLMGEAVERLTAGQSERVPPSYPDSIVQSNTKQSSVRMPNKSGAYRLFAYIYDDAGGAAVGNIPLFVK